jgi:hypothetical protein
MHAVPHCIIREFTRSGNLLHDLRDLSRSHSRWAADQRSCFFFPVDVFPVCLSSGIVGSMIPIYEDLLANTTIRILIYSGDVDSCVPYLGTEATVMTFPYVQRTPIQDPWQSWHYISVEAPTVTQIGGKFMQWDERLAYATVRGAGHMSVACAHGGMSASPSTHWHSLILLRLVVLSVVVNRRVPHDRPEAGAQLFYGLINDPTRMTFKEVIPRDQLFQDEEEAIADE